MTPTRSSRSEIDRSLARALRLIRQAAASSRRHTLRRPTRAAGPATYRHLTPGQLASAALAGLVVGQWAEREGADRFFVAELQRRDMTESWAAWDNDSANVSDTPLGEFETRLSQLGTLTHHSLDNLCEALDKIAFGDDGRTPGALSPAEVIEDMEATGMPAEAIDAYGAAVGASDTSLSQDLAVQGESPIPLLAAEIPPEDEAAHEAEM